jgi:hypothetical protein
MATSVGCPVFCMEPSAKICCAVVIWTPPPMAPSLPAVPPRTVSKMARDSLKPTVFVFARLLPMTPRASSSAISPDDPRIHCAVDRHRCSPMRLNEKVRVTGSTLPTLTSCEMGACAPEASVSSGYPCENDTLCTTPVTFCETLTDCPLANRSPSR